MTLVEKMARSFTTDWDGLNGGSQLALLRCATAALKAMREPSDVMESAGCNVVIGFSGMSPLRGAVQ